MRWIAPLSVTWVVAFFLAFAAFSLGFFVVGLVIGCIALAAFVALAELRCPTCGLELTRRDTRPFVLPSLNPLPRDCPGCGRTREDVYPLQWRRASET